VGVGGGEPTNSCRAAAADNDEDSTQKKCIPPCVPQPLKDLNYCYQDGWTEHVSYSFFTNSIQLAKLNGCTLAALKFQMKCPLIVIFLYPSLCT